MNGRRSLGGILIPTDDEIDRVGRVARQFEETDPVIEEMGDQGDLRDQVIQDEREVQGNQGFQNRQEIHENPPGRDLEDDIRMMRESGQPMLGNQSQPIVLDAAARSYELRSMHVNSLPSFHGLATEDCLQFISDYQGVVVTFPIGRLTEDQLRMRCFRYCLKDKGIKWYNSLKAGSLTTWADVCTAFFTRFFPAAKAKEIRVQIADFGEEDGESFHEAWTRYSELLTKLPPHMVTE